IETPVSAYAGTTASATDCVTPFASAVTVTAAGAATPVVARSNVAEESPAGMNTVAPEGSDASAGSLVVSVTVTPSAGAAPPSCTIPLVETPPITEGGERAHTPR